MQEANLWGPGKTGSQEMLVLRETREAYQEAIHRHLVPLFSATAVRRGFLNSTTVRSCLCHSHQTEEPERDQRDRHLRASPMTQTIRVQSSTNLAVRSGQRQMSQRQTVQLLHELALGAQCMRAMRESPLPGKM